MNHLLVFLLLLTTLTTLNAQKLVLDTLVVSFSRDSLSSHLSVQIDTVLDERDVDDPALLDYGEKNQYMFIPVDQKILAHRQITEVIQNGLEGETKQAGESTCLGLRHLDFSSQTQYFIQPVSKLHASVYVYNKNV